MALGQHRTVATSQCGKHTHRLITVAVWILHDRSGNRAVLDGLQGGIVLVEADNGNLVELAGLTHGLQYLRWVVNKHTYHAVDIRVAGEGVLDLRLGACKIKPVDTGVEYREGIALNHLVHRIPAS